MRGGYSVGRRPSDDVFVVVEEIGLDVVPVVLVRIQSEQGASGRGLVFVFLADEHSAVPDVHFIVLSAGEEVV